MDLNLTQNIALRIIDKIENILFTDSKNLFQYTFVPISTTNGTKLLVFYFR